MLRVLHQSANNSTDHYTGLEIGEWLKWVRVELIDSDRIFQVDLLFLFELILLDWNRV